MADVLTWKLSEIRTKFREIVGRSTTGAITDVDVNKQINDYTVNYFPEDALVGDLDDFNTFETSVDDNGQYALGQGVLKINDPVTVNNEKIEFYPDSEKFFTDYPEDEQYITAPGLAIGTDTAKVLNVAFKFNITGFAYSKASSETIFSGLSTVPQNKYGAFSLTIESDGTITINEASGNSTGYDSIAQAVQSLEAAGSDDAFMGYVTVISTDAGGFVPGTTALDDVAVTDTYTDGQPKNRNTPLACTRYANKLWIRPKADDIYQVKYPYRKRPEAFANDEAVPLDVKWGPMIALGAAILYLVEKGDQDRVIELVGGPVTLADLRMNSIADKKRTQNQRRYPKPSF